MPEISENAARAAVRSSLAALSREAEALLDSAVRRTAHVRTLLLGRDIEQAFEHAEALAGDVRRLRRVSREAAGLVRALGESDVSE